MSKNFKNLALAGFAAGLSVVAASADAGVTPTVAASCGGAQAPAYVGSYAPNYNWSGSQPSQGYQAYSYQGSSYNACSAPQQQSWGYDNTTAAGDTTNPQGWSSATSTQYPQDQYSQGQAWSSQTTTTNPQGSGYYYSDGQKTRTTTTTTTTDGQAQSTTTDQPSSGYYYNGQTKTTKNGAAYPSSAVNPNTTTNPMTTQPYKNGTYTR